MDPSFEKLKARWDEIPYPSAQYPPGSVRAGIVDGEDLALLDGDVGALVDGYLAGEQFASNDPMLRTSRKVLQRIVPQLSGPAYVYFVTALALIEWLEIEVSHTEADAQRE